MKRLTTFAREFKNDMTIIDIALLKTSVIALGLLIGMVVPGKLKKKTATCASLVFLLSSGPLTAKFAGKILEEIDLDKNEYENDIY
ncbi:permease of phosphate ABC transporter [Alkalibacter mobilis]|uniref:permease of phosphate ABC transporter n=1 Tax=Alkalibacter mobilis TaxID=2787712 RepID=UPI00189E105C|nr:permease of phosphate ABC transporter [Alkalibacter mobilis]MBF7097685.1 permease of phosphate ABC transporter [Alkalibacter mobilis]